MRAFPVGFTTPRAGKRHGLLAAILALALVLRLASIRFGLPALHDPDELMFELGAIRMLRGATLNPGWFGHPATTTMYVLALANISVFLTGWLAGWFPSVKAFAQIIYVDPSWIILPGRIAITLFGLATLVLIYRIGRRLFDPRVGLIAAGLMAISPVHISWSQIIRSDMMACFFLLLCLNAAIDVAERKQWRDMVLGALWLAAAVATKWPFALAGWPLAGALWLLVRDRALTVPQAAIRLLAIGTMAGLFLFFISPYLLLDYPTVLRNLSGEGQAQHLGATGGNIWQNASWYLTGPLYDGLGPIPFLLLLPGLALLWQQRIARILILPLLTGFFLLLIAQNVVWERWALPVLLLSAIAVAAVIARLIDWLAPWRPGKPSIAALAVIIAAPLLLRTHADATERLNDTRQVAAAWARSHIPPGSRVLVEHFAFDLLPQPWDFLFPIGDAGCVDARALLQGQTSYTPIDQARGTRSNLDYGTMAPRRRADCRLDFAILTQYDRYRRERAAFPAEYAAYRDLIARGRIVASFDPQPGHVGGRNVTILAFPARRP